MDAGRSGRENPAMASYRFTTYERTDTPRYIVVWDLQRNVVECRRLDPGTDLHSEMATTIERLAGEGWRAEGGAEYGFVFIRNGDQRRLLALTPRDPHDLTGQSFSPFASTPRRGHQG